MFTTQISGVSFLGPFSYSWIDHIIQFQRVFPNHHIQIDSLLPFLVRVRYFSHGVILWHYYIYFPFFSPCPTTIYIQFMRTRTMLVLFTVTYFGASSSARRSKILAEWLNSGFKIQFIGNICKLHILGLVSIPTDVKEKGEKNKWFPLIALSSSG